MTEVMLLPIHNIHTGGFSWSAHPRYIAIGTQFSTKHAKAAVNEVLP